MPETWGEFESRLQFETRAGHRRWLVMDPGTAHQLPATADPFDDVHAAVRALEPKLTVVATDVARMAADTGVFGPPEPKRCRTWDKALTTVSRDISGMLAYHHEASAPGLPDSNRYLLGLFGAGAGLLYQRTSSDGMWFEQQCFLIDPDLAIHRYYQFSR